MPTSNPDRPACPRCGAPLQGEGGECAACLLALAVEEPGEPSDEQRPPQPPLRPSAPPPTPEELAADFPQLEVLECIGAGGMGAVYRARHLALEREVAVKILSKALAADPRFAERFQREARALAKLDHPGIVRVHDFGRAGERWYLIMELVRGTSLRRRLAAGPLPPNEALAIVTQLARALEYAHGRGVVHRDIKPENVLVDDEGVARLADFGLAKLLHEPLDPGRTETGVTLGTPPYMAPEQLTRPQEVDHRADLYALGVLFYELLTGKLPLGRFDAPSRRAGVPADYDAVVLKLLEHEPQQRYQKAGEVGDALERLVGAATVGAREARAPASRGEERAQEAHAESTPQLDVGVLVAAAIALVASFCPWFSIQLPRRGVTYLDWPALAAPAQGLSSDGGSCTALAWNWWIEILGVQWPLWMPAVIALFLALESILSRRGAWRVRPLWRLALCVFALVLVGHVLADTSSPHVTVGIGSLATGAAFLALTWRCLPSAIPASVRGLVTVVGPRVERRPKSAKRGNATRRSRAR